jgi:hypothetical protein
MRLHGVVLNYAHWQLYLDFLLLIYCLFNDAASSSHYIASNGTISA